MALDLAAVATNEQTLTVDFMGQSAKVVYRPNALTQAALEKSFDDEGFVEFFADLVVSWDVTHGRKKVGLDKDSLKIVPLPFLRAVFKAIMEDDAAGEAGKPSSDG